MLVHLRGVCNKGGYTAGSAFAGSAMLQVLLSQGLLRYRFYSRGVCYTKGVHSWGLLHHRLSSREVCYTAGAVRNFNLISRVCNTQSFTINKLPEVQMCIYYINSLQLLVCYESPIANISAHYCTLYSVQYITLYFCPQWNIQYYADVKKRFFATS